MALFIQSPWYKENAKKQREKLVEEGLVAPEGQRLNKDAYNEALQKSGYTDEQAVNYWKAHNNDPYYNIGKTVDNIVDASAPKVTVSKGKVSISAPQSVLSSPYVSQLKKELQTLKGADLNSDTAQKAIKALNDQIKTNFSNSLINQATGWTPEEYADYQYALQTVTRPNPMSTSNKLKWAVDGEILKDDKGNIVMKTPQEWVNYWRENYNTDQRTDLFRKSLASTNPYERTMALVLSQGDENPIYGFDTWERTKQGLGAAWNQLKQFPTGTLRLLFTDDKTAHLEELLEHTGLKAGALQDFSVTNEDQFNTMRDAISGKAWDDLTTGEKAFVMITAVSQEGYRPKNAFLRAPETGETDIEKMYREKSISEGAIKRILENASFDKYRETRNNFNTWQRYDEENSKDEERLSKNAAWSGGEQFWGNLGGVLGRYLWENAVFHGLTGGVGSGGKGGINMNSTSEKIGEKLVSWLSGKGISPASTLGQGILQFGANLIGTIPEDLMQDAVDNIVTYNAKENENLLTPQNMGESFKRNLVWLSLFNGAKAGLNAVKKARLISKLKKVADLNQEMDIDGIASDADDIARAMKNGDQVIADGEEVRIIDENGNERVLKSTTPEQAQMALFDADDYAVVKGAETADVPKVDIDADDAKAKNTVGQTNVEDSPKVEVGEEAKTIAPEASGEVNINKFKPTTLAESLKAKFQATPDSVKKWHKATRDMLNAQLQTHLNEFHDKFGDVRASDFDWVWYQGRQGKTPSQIIGSTDPTTGRVVTKNMIDAMQWWSDQPFVKDLRKASRESLGLEGDFDRLGYLPHTDYDPSNLSYEEAMTGALWENASGKSVIGDDGNYKGYGGDLPSRYDTFASNMLWDARKTDVVAAKILEDAEMDGQEITPELIEESRKAAEGAKEINRTVAESPSAKDVIDTLSGKKGDVDFDKINKNIEKEGRNSGLGKAIHDNYQTVYRGANTMEVTKQRKGLVNSFDTLANRMRNTVIGNGMSMYDWGGADMVYALKNAGYLVEDYMRNGGDFRTKLVDYVKNHSHRSDMYAEQVADKWMARIGAIEGPRTKGKVIEELYKAMRSEARTRLNKWLVMANYDGTLQADGTYKGGFNDSTKKMINQFLFDHTLTDAVVSNKNVMQKIGSALDLISSMRYRALFYGNIKNALLQVSELNRFFYTFKWGDVKDMAKRMATDANFRARVETMTKAVAPDVSILDADLYQSYSAAADSMDVGEKGVKFKDLGEKTTDAADKIGLAPIEAAESFKNHMMVAGLVQEADRLGLDGDDALRYIRQRFERVALAADEMGKIGLASNPLAKPMLFLQNFQIRELGMHLYNIEDMWKYGKNIPQKLINEVKYITKVLGSKLGTTLILARLGYPASQALGLDPFGIMDNYNNSLDEDEKTALDKQLTNGLLTPFLSGGMTSLIADFYFLGRKAYEDSVRKTTSDEAEQNLDQGVVGGWKFPTLSYDQIFGGLAQNFAPGATAFNRFNQMNQMMDSGWATSATGNKMYSAPDDPLNVLLGYLFGRSATANAQQYNQAYGDNLLQTIGRFMPWRSYQEFDPIDTKNYSDWFKGNENDAQQFQKGIRYFREERNRVLRAFNEAINDVGATDDDIAEAKNTMNTRLNDVFDQLDRFVDAYEKKNGTITPAMTKQVINVLNIGQKNTSDTPEEAQERSQREYNKALGRYSDLGMSPVETWTGPDGYNPDRETKLQGSPQYRSATNRYWNLGSEAAQVLKAADSQLSGVRKDLKSSINAAYDAKDYDTLEKIQKEYLNKFDQVVAPIIALYGNSILKRSDVTDQLRAMLSTGTSSRSADLIPSGQYRKDKYGRYRSMPYETVDVKKWAQQRYSGNLYKNPTTRIDSTPIEELNELKGLVQSGKPQRALAKALQIKVRVDNQEFAISKNDYQWLVNFLKNGGK